MIDGVAAVGRHVVVHPIRGDVVGASGVWRPGLGDYDAPVLMTVASAGPAAIDVFPFVPGLQVIVQKYAGTAFGLRRPDGSQTTFYVVDAGDVIAIWHDGALVPLGDRLVVEPLTGPDRVMVGSADFATVLAVSARSPVRPGDVVIYPPFSDLLLSLGTDQLQAIVEVSKILGLRRDHD